MELVNLSSCATALADRTIDNDRPLLAESLISAEKAGTYGCLLSIAMMSEEGQVSRVFLLTSCVKSELSRISSRAAKRRNDRILHVTLGVGARRDFFIFFCDACQCCTHCNCVLAVNFNLSWPARYGFLCCRPARCHGSYVRTTKLEHCNIETKDINIP